MVAGEKLRDSEGHEVMLFPCEVMYLTPARDPAEHDILAMDFLPRNAEGEKISPMNVYAPFTGKIVYTGNDHNCILESDEEVRTPAGLSKMRVLVAHSYSAPILGTHYNQGDLWYQTGNYGNSTGEHLHIEAAIGGTSGSYWNSDGIGLKGGVHLYDAMYVNDTVLLRPGEFNWLTFDGGITPVESVKKSHHYPWVLYARKLRARQI